MNGAASPTQDSAQAHHEQEVSPAVLWLPFAYLWIQLLHLLGKYTWHHGPKTFVHLLGLLSIFVIARPIIRSFQKRLSFISRIPPVFVGIGLSIAVLFSVLKWKNEYIVYINHPNDALIDIGANTIEAANHLIHGNNPYEEKCQTRYQAVRGPNITVEDGVTRMFGIPYYFGYTYFPAMFIAYIPFWVTIANNHAIRWGNLFFSIICLLSIIWLTLRLVPKPLRFAACALATCIWFYTDKIPQQIYFAGITDVVILMFSLFGFIELTYKRHFTAGLMFGLAQACKLLPGPFLLVPFLLWSADNKNRRQLLLGYVLASVAFIFPFFLWHPSAFLSSTILYYLTFHSLGDTTALWFYLPEWLKTPFFIFGIISTGLILLLARYNRSQSNLSWPLSITFCAYVAFIAFSKMSHLNYLWSVYGLGCVAIASLMAQPMTRKSRA